MSRSTASTTTPTPTGPTPLPQTHHYIRFAISPALGSADALEIRSRVLCAFEAAEGEDAPARRAEWITFVVVGGGPTGLELAGALSARLGQTVIVENRAGASGTTATLDVARSAPDGYVLELAVSTHASLAAINKTLPYDAERDFAPVVFIGSIPLVLIVGQKSPFATLSDLIAAAKANPADPR